MTDMRPILIAGPTASGKSGLALRLAEHLGGVVINADSMQVYRDLRILTARPTPEEEARVPHALYGFVPGAETYSAGRFADEGARARRCARVRGAVRSSSAGTGLYFKALLEGLSPIPPVPDAVRAHWRARGGRGAARCTAFLRRAMPAMAQRLAPGDTQRIVRALEVLEATGVVARRLAADAARAGPRLSETIPLVVTPEREELYRRIDARFEAMMEAGRPRGGAALEALRTRSDAAGHDARWGCAAAAPPRGKAGAGGGHRRGQGRDAPVRQTAGHLDAGNMSAWNSIYAQEMEILVADFISFY